MLTRVCLLSAILFGFAAPALAAGDLAADGTKQPLDLVAIGIFLAFVASTLGITWWAAKRVKSRRDFLVAGGGITPLQNGLAIAGDFMSAATFLGITGAIYFNGADAILLGVGIMVGWPFILMMIAERFRNLGRYTFIDVVSYRLDQRPMRIMASCVSLSIVIFYLIAQMVGAGTLIQILFGLDYLWAVIIVGCLMVIYVAFGGMVATTWVQLIKACLLLVGGSYLAFAILHQFGFSVEGMLAESVSRHPAGETLLLPGRWLNDAGSVVTVGLTMMFGVVGLPHVLMRFFTVKDARDARKSVFYATSIMGYFYILIMIIGLGSVAILFGDPEYLDADGRLRGGANMVAIHLSGILGGPYMLGFMSAVSFATILAVVAGLTLSGAATIAHDLYAHALHRGDADEEKVIKLTKLTTVVIGLLAIAFGFAFEGQNVAITAGFALAVAASVNFPIIFLAMYWSGLTTRGAIYGGAAGLVAALVPTILSQGVWVAILGNEQAIFPYIYPTIIAMPITFVVVMLVSVLDRSDKANAEREKFAEQFVRSESGIGALDASDH